MFFPEKITAIKDGDYVLEIGPGSNPHPRSDVLLERVFESVIDASAQRGNTPPLKTDKKLVFYKGERFPFNDKEFDYVICSHVLEHVDNVDFFMSELFRIASRGYLEYPTVYYEYLYNFNVHLNFLKFHNGKLLYLNKSQTNFGDFLPVQKFFYKSLECGHSKLVEDLQQYMFEGFEWYEPFEIFPANTIKDLTFKNYEISIPPKNLVVRSESLGYRFVRKIKNKLRVLFK